LLDVAEQTRVSLEREELLEEQRQSALLADNRLRKFLDRVVTVKELDRSRRRTADPYFR
jgi:hypothetical protein